MAIDTRTHARVKPVRNRTATDAFAGYGNLHSWSETRGRERQEFMREGAATKFHDIVFITGRPKFMIPIGTATFPYRIAGRFEEQAIAGAVDGEADFSASFRAIGLSFSERSTSGNIPSLVGPTINPLDQLISVTVSFIIGQPIVLDATLDGEARSRTSQQQNERLTARLALSGTLDPIIVVGVDDPHITSQSGTQYALAPAATGVLLLQFALRLLRRD